MSDPSWGAPPGGGGGWGTAPGGAPPASTGAPSPFVPTPGSGGAAPPGQNQLALASIAAGVLSIASTFCCCIPILGALAYVVVPVAGIVAVVTGVLGLQHANRTGVGKVESIVGIALGSVGVLEGLFLIGVLLLYGGAAAYGILSQPGVH